MPKKPPTIRQRLRQAGIQHYDELIHDQPKEWLIKNFSQGADEYPVNVVRQPVRSDKPVLPVFLEGRSFVVTQKFLLNLVSSFLLNAKC